MSEAPSRFHKKVFANGKTAWRLDREHPELKSSLYCKIDGDYYCAYCGKKCISLQGFLGEYRRDSIGRPPGWCYTTTGYTCDCVQARLERERDDLLGEMKSRHAKEEQELRSRFRELVPNKIKLCDIKHAKEKERIERGWGDSEIIPVTREYKIQFYGGEE